MTSWDLYRNFLEIQRAGSLKKAATNLGVNQTTIGRNLNVLERQIGTRLFERRSDGFVLTSAGNRILDSMVSVEQTLLGVQRRLAGEDERPEGEVKLAMPGGMANFCLPRIGPLLKKNPGLLLRFLTGPEVLNLIRREADLAIRIVKPNQKELVSKRIGTLELGFYANVSMFELTAPPKRVNELAPFPFVALHPDSASDAENALLAEVRNGARVRVLYRTWSSAFTAIGGGVGIGILPTFYAKENPNLVRILKDHSARIPIWLAYHPDLRKSARVRVVIDFFTALIEREM
jgi:DNA-binding transcriptional LysR family regulator